MLTLLGRLPLAAERLRGEPLYLLALRTLEAVVDQPVILLVDPADVARVRAETTAAGSAARVVDEGSRWWESPEGQPRGLLVHDPLCPLVPAGLLDDVRRAGAARGVGAAAVRPVSDTVKTVTGGLVSGTVDREGLSVVCAPVYLPAGMAAEAARAGAPPPGRDLAELVGWLRARGPVELVEAPVRAMRVDDGSALSLLECLDAVEPGPHQASRGAGTPPAAGLPGR